jgi:hypothetical protein
MAGQGIGPSPEEQARAAELSRLSYRDDLADSFGIMIAVAKHGPSPDGVIKYGYPPMPGGFNDQEMAEAFKSEMSGLIVESMSGLVDMGIISEEAVTTVKADPYSLPPAAQEWPKVFFDLYQDARPFLADGASLLAWGYFLRDAISRIWIWSSNKEREQSGPNPPENASYTGQGIMPGIALTRPAILALCYLDLIERHGIKEKITIDAHSRTSPFFISSVDHPGGRETYLVKAKAGSTSFFYIVRGSGDVIEHFSTSRSTLTLLELPNFVEQPGPDYRGKIGPSTKVSPE